MLQVHDIRETRVYQEAVEEGIEKGIHQGVEKGIEQGIEQGVQKERQRGLEEKLRAMSKLAAKKIPADEIADILGLDVEFVRQQMSRKLS